MPIVNVFQVVLGLIFSLLGYQIARRTGSEAIQIMAWIIVVLGIVLIANGVGVINIPQLGNPAS